MGAGEGGLLKGAQCVLMFWETDVFLCEVFVYAFCTGFLVSWVAAWLCCCTGIVTG